MIENASVVLAETDHVRACVLGFSSTTMMAKETYDCGFEITSAEVWLELLR